MLCESFCSITSTQYSKVVTEIIRSAGSERYTEDTIRIKYNYVIIVMC